jgi:hypothetical protein
MTFKPLALALLAGSLACQGKQNTPAFHHDTQPQRDTPGFAIDKHKPYIWFEFDHYGLAKPDSESSTREYMWLRLHNNCSQTLSVIINGDLSDALQGERTVHFWTDDDISRGLRVVANPPSSVLTIDKLTDTNAERAKTPKPKNPGYFPPDFGSPYLIRPRENVLFRVPADAVGPDWHLVVPVQFANTSGPSLNLIFSRYDIPATAYHDH